MTEFARIAVRSPQPFDIVGDTFSLCGLGTSFEGVIGRPSCTTAPERCSSTWHP